MSLPHHLAAGELLTALRGASCGSSALRLYSLLRIHLPPSDPSLAGRAAVFALKPLSAAGSLPLLSHFHAHLIRSNLLAYPQVASSLLRSYSLLSPAVAHHLFDQMPPATSNLFVVNVMLSSLCRSSDLASARLFFDDIPDKDIVSWSTMLACYLSNKSVADGLAFFRTMTFTTTLAPLVEQGREFFKLMVEEYDLEPTIHHYGCMVDIFAKAGQLEDAYDVIKTMRVEPNIIIWTSLLAACKRLKNFDIAMEGLEKVLAMEISDENAGLYTLMSDLYAMGGRWDDVLKVRRLMEEHNVRNNRGSSSIKAGKPPGLIVPAVS
uniref:Pentatricopeptide repeat-containing protein n=1 Tax=Triticum urartu TaxID=4572 RepID=A0A8R7TZ86_TRIUA